MTNITLRAVKGSPLTNNEVDSNFNSLNVYKVELTDSSGSVIIPAGTTAERDQSPSSGYLRYNTDNDKLEVYANSSWANIGENISSISYADGNITLTTSDSSYTTALGLVGGQGITYTAGTGTIDITNTSVTAGTYGSAAQVPVFTVNAQGQIDSAGSVAVAGVASFTFDSATGNLTIGTADGGSFSTLTTLDPYTTTDVTFAKITGDSASLDGITFNAQATPFAGNVTPGSLWFDSDPQKGLSFKPATPEGNTSLTLNLGQESVVFSHNATGETIPNGTVVYVSGTAHGIHPSITKAQANVGSPGNLGVTTMDIVDGAHGYVTRFGLVRGLNTNGLSAGADVWLSADSAGVWTTTPVTVDTGYPYHIGKVVATDATEGTILVDPFRENFEYLRIQDRLRVTGGIEGTTLALDSSMSMTPIAYANRPAYVEGKMWYDGDGQTMAFHTDTEDYIQFVGEREWVRGRNSTGSTILKGTPVYTDGAHIAGHPIHGHHPLIHPADAADAAKYEVIGIAGHDIADGSHGYVITRGWIDGLNTASLVSGDRLHLAAGGGYQQAAATYPNYPVDLGIAMTVDSVGGNGSIYVDINSHTLEQLRITGSGRVDGNWTVGGNLNVIGTTTSTLNQSVIVPSQFILLLDGDTLGTAYQSVGGLNDATFKGKYTGDANLFYFARISALDSIGAGGDTIEWGISDSETMSYGSLVGGYGYGLGFESDGGQTTWQLGVDGLRAPLREGISLQFISRAGHSDSDLWCAHPVEINADVGMIANYNPSGAGGLLHTGVFRDVTDSRWKFFDGYDSALDSASTEVNTANAGFSLADIQFGTAYGALSGNASTATSATQLTTARTIAMSGDITAAGVAFNGTGNISLTAAITAGSIINADINASAAIVDTKLATISTAGKVQNGATTATSANTGSAIVARDASGNFSAGTVTAALTGAVTGAVTTTLVKFNDSDASNWVAFSGPHSPAANVTWTLPNADGSSGQALVTNGGGTLSWAAAGAVTTVDEATNTNFLIHFDGTTSGAVTAIKHDTGLTYNPSTGTLAAATFSGALTGNAATATQLATTRAIQVSGAVTGTANFDGSAGINIVTTNTADPTITLAGDLTGSVTLTNLASGTLTATIAANSVALGTDTTGNYVGAGAVSGTGLSGSLAAEGGTFTVTSNATSANTASTIVARDASGNFTAGTITASLTGDVSGSSGSTTGNAATATILQTARTIGGVSFNGGAAINLPGVDTTGNQNTSGNAATATYAAAVTLTADNATAATNYPLFANAATGNLSPRTDTGLTYNPSTGVLTSTTFSGALSGNATTSSSTTGNAATATVLATARAINGVNFNGSGAITVTAAAGTLSGATLAAGVTASSLTSVGTIATGTWQGSSISTTYTDAKVTAVNGVTGAVTAAQLLTAIKTVDGTLSALDADLLDGQHGTYYRINVYNSAGTLLN